MPIMMYLQVLTPEPDDTQATENTPMQVDASDMPTESEMQSTQDNADSQSKAGGTRKRVSKRNKLSLKRTTTQYNQVCGVCQIPHTRRRTSILCSCGFYVHLHCLGLKSLHDLQVQNAEQWKCKCKHHLMSSLQRHMQAENVRRKVRHAKTATTRGAPKNTKQNMQDSFDTLITACLLIAILTAHEQTLIQQGCYVRLHGLNKQHYNGQEGMVIKCEQDKVEVRLADAGEGQGGVVKIHRRNLTLMPTYFTSRCKRMQHQTVEIIFFPEPVFSWPKTLTGNYFDFLRIERTATTDQIKAAFRNLSVLLHPDKNPTHKEKATSLFKQIREAYEALKDEHNRAMYLMELRAQEMRQQRFPFGFGRSSHPRR